MEKSVDGLDDIDGALFSRIPSKQCNIEKLANRSLDTTGHDGVDGALFSRIPSQKDASAASRTYQNNQPSRHAGDENPILECSIKPEDLSDEDVIPECQGALLGKGKSRKEQNFSPCGSSSSSCYDDLSDAVQGSRVSLQLDDESEIRSASSSTFYTGPEIRPVSSSTFYTGPEVRPVSSSTFYTEPEIRPVSSSRIFTEPTEECENDTETTSENDTHDNGVAFYLQGNEEQNTALLSDNFNQPRPNVEPEHGKGRTVPNVISGESYEMTHLKYNDAVTPPDDSTTLNNIDERDASVSSKLYTDSKKIKRSTYWKLTKALLFPAISLVIYFWDIASDIRLAVSYRENGDINLFWITLSCIIFPHILMAVVDVSWVWLDRKSEHKHGCRIVLGCLTLGRIVRALSYMRHVYKAKLIPKLETGNQRGHTRDWHKARARDEKRDCFMLDFINAFMESAPQLFVQLYLYYAYSLELTLLRVLNLLSSWISIAWTYAAYYRCNREALAGKQDVKIIGFAFFFCSALSALAARFICTSLFLVHFYTWIGITFFTVHFIVMFLWICLRERPELQGTTTSTCGRNLFYVFFAYVCILCFMNLNDTRAKLRMTLFYVVIYIENTIMAALSIWKINESDNGNDTAIHLIVLPAGCVLHVVLLVNYYLFLHPKTGLCYNCNHIQKR